MLIEYLPMYKIIPTLFVLRNKLSMFHTLFSLINGITYLILLLDVSAIFNSFGAKRGKLEYRTRSVRYPTALYYIRA